MTLQRPIKLVPQYQRYAWGTQDAITQLLNLEPLSGPEPVAELWMGEHPSLPSPLATPVAGQKDLHALIDAQPEAVLGPRHQEFAGRLPYLFKVLSAGQALSVQVHPSKAQAEAGYAHETKRGISLRDPTRSYKDANHKPELLLALTEFHAMAGFRQPQAVAERLNALDSPELRRWADRLEQEGLPALEALYAFLLNLSQEECRDLLAQPLKGLPEGEDYQWVAQLHEQYGDDPGVLFPLVLNRFRLRPGEAIVLAAGVPHAYLLGTGLEVMASSDNVLRGGLTEKHMDVPELLHVTEVQPDAVQPQVGQTVGAWTTYEVPFKDFQLALADLQPGAPETVGTSGSAELFLQLSGECLLGGETLKQGDIVLLPASLGETPLTGEGRIARVHVG